VSTPEQEMTRLSRRGFLWTGVALLGGYGGVKYLASRSNAGGTPWPFRTALEANEGIWHDGLGDRLSPEFSRSALTALRQNGDEGLGEDFDPEMWALTVEGIAGEEGPKTFSLAEIKALPRHEMITEMCCIEGWSMVVQWAGVRLRDFMAKYPPITQSGNDPDLENGRDDLVRYVAMETPDMGYYIGLDMQSALHPQTLLCYEMNGKPLTLDHGAPLRLAIPVKYGIKNIKRIGTIRYTNDRPKDFWAEQGYDWYSGL
jgi:DMSO/TMAO reductase YedYZ molybdopterin-dependent catalytic subunit